MQDNDYNTIWEWWWGDSNSKFESNKMMFEDFDEMKTFSAKHAYVTKTYIGDGYYSNYEKIELK
jgi:hypothetical protein